MAVTVGAVLTSPEVVVAGVVLVLEAAMLPTIMPVAVLVALGWRRLLQELLFTTLEEAAAELKSKVQGLAEQVAQAEVVQVDLILLVLLALQTPAVVEAVAVTTTAVKKLAVQEVQALL